VGKDGSEVVSLSFRETTRLNVICPYFTMFPLSFPLSILKRYGGSHDLVLDPFCGRGTTNFAARMLGLPTVGIDSSPIAVATTAAKLVHSVCPSDIIVEAHDILTSRLDYSVPTGRFWSLAYKPSVLDAICKLRAALLENCRTNRRKALRGILLGALHGPLQRRKQFIFFQSMPPHLCSKAPLRRWILASHGIPSASG
jgi:hypothetical protein